MQKCKYAEVYISVNGSSKKKRCCICCIYLDISLYIHIFACTHNVPVSFHWISVLFLSHSCGFLRIPADSGAIPADSGAIPEDSGAIPEDSCRNGRGTVKYFH